MLTIRCTNKLLRWLDTEVSPEPTTPPIVSATGTPISSSRCVDDSSFASANARCFRSSLKPETLLFSGLAFRKGPGQSCGASVPGRMRCIPKRDPDSRDQNREDCQPPGAGLVERSGDTCSLRDQAPPGNRYYHHSRSSLQRSRARRSSRGHQGQCLWSCWPSAFVVGGRLRDISGSESQIRSLLGKVTLESLVGPIRSSVIRPFGCQGSKLERSTAKK